jgi:hypothetical protein
MFCYTLWHFYAFSGTNLLTRCHSASSLFSAIFVFQKSYTGIFSELDETKTKVPFFSDTRRSPKKRRKGARGRPHHRVARLGPGPHHQVVGPPGRPPDATLLPIYSPRWENPKPDQFTIKHTASRRRHRREIGRIQELFPAPCQRGESPPEAFFITMPASGVMCE